MPARRNAKSLNLSAGERFRLESMADSGTVPAALRRRAKMVLWTEQGLSDRETARRLQVSQPTVGLWRRRFRAARLAGLRDAQRPGRPRVHDEKRIARLIATALNTTPVAGPRWTVRTLSKVTRMSKSTVWRYLRLHQAGPHRGRGAASSD